ncbi:SRPBCC family protein [Mucilaginibacter boryungensis]|uniref:SRPBCC family protein n=1 Tax=Mucilaginibacter boryungensis TaxID=768480 RepID=A0ABR9XMA3_9SPHI|nr:SRPBCC family protein [Mucilaginibacter boryungensis]MBE9668340.1 SRPBCC family protein [Mucilaginibacter boryungensis]
MPTIKLITSINAPVEVCFDLARSIDLHKTSMQHTGEKAVAGITDGLIGLNETVTWRARHFGIAMEMTSKITELRYAISFTDEQVKGPFKKLKHLHTFQQSGKYTIMTDYFEFESPLGFLGRLADKLMMKAYLTQLLLKRNKTIKETAENAKNL